ncbi:tetratricopeptide repeat protein [Myroides fluvii]|uniref:tetratricopeptide repeat protein n=1 Tax=Myroides fluvii TaxID=2572594 RepID=UPI00131E3F84|nr:tetratricopeptide repeat protein [Myroides fluvii]
MKKLTFYLVFALLSICSYAQPTDWQKSFDKVNEAFQKEHFKEAIDGYLALVNEYDNSPELYFNLANAYFKIGDYVHAAYYYEKTLKLNPSMQEAKTNLNFTKEHLEDDITIIQEYDKADIAHQSLGKLSVDSWAVVATLSSVALLICFIVYFINHNSTLKRLLFVGMALSVVVGLGSLYAASFESNYTKNSTTALIFKAKTDFKEEAKTTSATLKELHQGTKVYLLEEKGLWLKVRLENQEIGWINKDVIREI